MQESPLRRNISGQDLVLLWLLVPFVRLVFETGSFYVDQAGFELVSQLPNPRSWDSLCARPRLALFFFGSVSSQNGVAQPSSTSWSMWASPSLTCRLKCSLDTNFQSLTALPQSLLSSASVYQASLHSCFGVPSPKSGSLGIFLHGSFIPHLPFPGCCDSSDLPRPLTSLEGPPPLPPSLSSHRCGPCVRTETGGCHGCWHRRCPS